MRRSLPFALVLTGLLILVVAWNATANDRLRNAVVEGTHHGGSAAAFAAAGISTERACVFRGTAGSDEIHAELGFIWSERPQMTATEELVIAANSNNVVAWAIVPAGSTGTLVSTGFGCGEITYRVPIP